MAVPETTDTENKGFSITTFLSETKVELKKVTWPTKQELIANYCSCFVRSSNLDY